MQIHVVAVIPARAGSKEVSRKNTRVIAGKPLIAHTIAAAVGSRYLQRIVVSTDCPQIASISRQFGAETPFTRPAHLGQDDALLLDVIRHAARYLERHQAPSPTHIVTLPPICPLLQSVDIEGAVQLAVRTGAPAVASVCELGEHPYHGMRMTKAGVLEPFMRVDLDSLRRQEYPPAYTLNGAIRVNTIDSILRDRTLHPAGTQGFVMPQSRSQAICTLWDLYVAELLLRDQQQRRAA